MLFSFQLQGNLYAQSRCFYPADRTRIGSSRKNGKCVYADEKNAAILCLNANELRIHLALSCQTTLQMYVDLGSVGNSQHILVDFYQF